VWGYVFVGVWLLTALVLGGGGGMVGPGLGVQVVFFGITTILSVYKVDG
jgi:hypothetical protein